MANLVMCTACGYDLRGLPTLVCPECGERYVARPAMRPIRPLLGFIGATVSLVASLNAARWSTKLAFELAIYDWYDVSLTFHCGTGTLRILDSLWLGVPFVLVISLLGFFLVIYARFAVVAARAFFSSGFVFWIMVLFIITRMQR